MKVTVWERYNDKSKAWEHNHIEDGLSDNDAPIAVSQTQKQSWANAQWKKRAAVLIAGALLSGCITKSACVDLPIPDRPTVPAISAGEIACLSPDVRRKLGERQGACKQYADEVEEILKSTH